MGTVVPFLARRRSQASVPEGATTGAHIMILPVVRIERHQEPVLSDRGKDPSAPPGPQRRGGNAR